MKLFRPLLLFFALAMAAMPSRVCAQTEDLPTLRAPAMTLGDALQVAARNSVTLSQKQADAAMASASAQGAQAPTRPLLSTTTYAAVGDSANLLTTSPGVAPQNIFLVAPRGFADQNLMLMVPLSTGGKLRGDAVSAQKEAEASALALRAAALTVTESVTSAYVNVLLQQALIDVAQARVSAEDEQVRVTQEKVRVGRSAPVDLRREQAEQADARQALLSARNAAALAVISLKTVLAVAQESQIAPAETLDSVFGASAALPDTLSAALRRSEARRPELAAARLHLEAAQAAVRGAQGEYAPQIYGMAMADLSAGQGVGRAGYTVGLTASLPLLDGGLRRANVDGAKARVARARADAQQARQEVDQDTAAAWLNFESAGAQGEAARTGVAAAQEGYTLASLRYNAGKSVAAERLDSQAALVRAQGADAQAKAALVIARARLFAALGEP